ncbi:OFA family MFS transporter [Acetivibrio saccincola]|uniref:MFS transporter n=1 Tax=Acetivibrio saccincola TaxID=1677857 RepID=A0A2S8R9P0_9FIRM|nr:OFA family MFS transporter [Acetivibrio saccincola]PQQ66502.1 MFS transporter [Acetivibrio saccincola]
MKQKYNRIIPVIAAIAIQLCLGTAYIWSVFQNGIASSIFGGSNADAALTFSLLLALLGIGGTIGGTLQNKIGPRITVIIGGLILSIGFFVASFTTSSVPWLLWLTYGVLGGIGMGFTYSTTIACAQKWFPDKRGFVTGIIVSALGFGGVVFTPIVESIISTLGKGIPGQGELLSFRILSFIFLIVCTVGGLMVKNPSEGFKPEGWTPKVSATDTVALTTLEVIKTPQLYLLTFSLMLACMGGLMMIGFAKPIAIARGLAETATIGVFAITMFNAFGRLFWGGVSDKLGCKKTIILLLALTAVLSLCVNIAGGYMIYVLIACIGFAYGGFLSTFPAYTAELFGTKYNATNYGIVLIGFGIGAVASSIIAGIYKDIAKDDINLMFPAFVIASLAAAVAIIMVLLVKPVSKKSG